MSMVDAADRRNLNDLAAIRRLDLAGLRRISVEREVRSRPVVVREVALLEPSEMCLVQDDDRVEALPTNGTHDAFGEWVLPGGPCGDEGLLHREGSHDTNEVVAGNTVAVTEKETRCDVARERFSPLSPRPTCSRMLGDVEVQDSPALVGEDDEDEQDSEGRRGYREEVDGTICFTWFSRNARHVGDGGSRHRGMYLATVAWDTSMPSSRISP